MLKRIKYVSRFADALPAPALTELEAQCVRNNTARGLTGVLMAAGGLFFQILEGEAEAVDAVLAIIARDPRHRDLLLLSEETTEQLRSLGFTVLPSSANFVFAKSDRLSGEELYVSLKSRGVLVRHFTKARIKDFCRISIGTREQMQILVSNIQEILTQKGSNAI